MLMTDSDLALVCLSCGSKLKPEGAETLLGAETLYCPDDGTFYHSTDGIWRFLSPAREAELAGFLSRYATVRGEEGWGSEDPAYYRELPFRDLSGLHPEIWRIRAVTYRVFLRRVVRPLADRMGGSVPRVLDVGAGNGWLSYRLGQKGHRCAAVDLMIDGRDGLGAGRFYPEKLFRVQASFDELPWADGVFDLVVFNGAFHYSKDYATTLREALRLLRPGGQIVIMDTPIYKRRASGEQMLKEREASLRERYGFTEQDRNEGYLTGERLDRLGDELKLDWRVLRPFYGLRWMLLPWKARLLGQRELMRFHLLVARRRGA